ncbi:hypothetical protein N0V95_008514 [Ascochyta clinopodiicola]|nr:hypothetical protein N0V95_008514 [Ascochyta clinopodiicola]
MSKQDLQTEDFEPPYNTDHYPLFLDPAEPAIFLPAWYFEDGVYTDEEQDLNLDLHEAMLNGQDLADAHRSAVAVDKDVTVTVSEVPATDGEDWPWALEGGKGKCRSFAAHQSDRHEAKLHGNVEVYGQPTKHSSPELTIDTTAPAPCEHVPRETRREQREAKCEQMRTQRPVDLDLETKFAHLRTDPPSLLQPEAVWTHEQLRLANEARIREKALSFKYCLRMSMYAGVPEGRKSCFARRPAEGEWYVEKVVRFDDVHVAKKVKWVDVEHVQELARTQYEVWRDNVACGPR